jgi:hypothetical protein
LRLIRFIRPFVDFRHFHQTRGWQSVVQIFEPSIRSPGIPIAYRCNKNREPLQLS